MEPAVSPHSTSAGFFHHFWALCEAAVKYVFLRGQLVVSEAKEAGSHYGLIAGLFVAALLLALFGYLFLVITAVFALALLIDGPHGWIMILGGAAVLHLLAAGGLVFMAKARFKTGLFAQTKEEFQKDRLWLNHPPKP